MLPQDMKCRRCDAAMQVGFVADNADSGYLMQGRWVEGLPEASKFLGMKTGNLNVKNRQSLPLLAYRCPVCSCVELFALNEEQAEQELLRAAQGAGEVQGEELLRAGQGTPSGG